MSRSGKDWLERVYQLLLFDIFWPEDVNWQSREIVTRLLREIRHERN